MARLHKSEHFPQEHKTQPDNVDTPMFPGRGTQYWKWIKISKIIVNSMKFQ